MASKTSGRGRTNTRKKTTAASKRAAAKKQAQNEFIRDEVKVLILFAVSVLLLISNFGVGGAVGGFVSSVMFGLFGLFAYILPVVLFLLAAFSISNRESTIAAVKIAAMAAAGLILCAVVQMINGEKGGAETIAAFYTFSAHEKLGGGVLGGLICKVLTGAFGTIGAWIILIALLIISGVIISERSFISGVKSGSKKVYDTAKEDARRHRILAEERRQARYRAMEERKQEEEPKKEEPKISRIEKKVSGVDLEGTSIRKEEHTDEMREITLEAEPELKDLDEMFRIPIHRQRSGVEESEEKRPEESEELLPEILPQMEKDVTSQMTVQDIPLFKPDPSAFETEPQPIQQPVPQSVQQLAVKPVPKKRPYIYPPLKLLNQIKHTESKDTDRILHETAMHLQQILRNFGVGATVTDVSQGPSVTRYEIQPDQGVKVSKIVSLSDDIKLNLAVADIRIEAPIPGKAAVGIEVPNAENSVVSFRELVASQEFKTHKSRIAFAVGKDIAGKIMVTDIAKMPHLLIAGATGSGKSVCINTLIMSILYKANPEEVKLIMVDPKVRGVKRL